MRVQGISWVQQWLCSLQQGPGPPTHEILGWTAVYTLCWSIPDVEQGKVLVFTWFGGFPQHALGYFHGWFNFDDGFVGVRWHGTVFVTPALGISDCQFNMDAEVWGDKRW